MDSVRDTVRRAGDKVPWFAAAFKDGQRNSLSLMWSVFIPVLLFLW